MKIDNLFTTFLNRPAGPARPIGKAEFIKLMDLLDTVHPSPTRSAIFDAGTTSRINVADFMARLITEDELWHRWKGQMPVIYNKDGPD